MSLLSRAKAFFTPSAPRADFGGAYGHTGDSRLRKDAAYLRSWPTDEDRNIGAYGRNRVRLECLDQVRNNAVVAGLIERFQNYAVGPHGISPQAKTSDAAWNKQAENYFNEWCKVADYRGRLSFAGILRLAEASTFHSGECFFALTDNGRLQPIEAERVGTPADKARDPSIIDGVKLSPDGIVLGYYVFTRGESGLINNGGASEFVDAADMIHYVAPGFRFDQIRGTPRIAACLNSLRDYRDFQDSTLLTARQQAKVSLAIKTEIGAARSAVLGARDATPTTVEKKQKQEAFGDLSVFNLLPGESVESFHTSAPGPQFEGFSVHILREFGARFGLPYELLMLDFQKGSFSQSRAALLTFQRTIEADQCNLRDTICQRVWNWKIAQAIKQGVLPAAPKDEVTGFSTWYKVVWQSPPYEQLLPGEQVAAEMDEYRLGKRCLADITKSTGRDYEDVLEDKGREIQRAQEIVTSLGLDKFGLTWRDMIDAATNSQRPMETEGQKEREEEDRAEKAEGLNKWLT